MEARVTLRPGSRGTKQLTREFGDRLICVRYRYDVEKKRRYKTVEVIVDEAPWEPQLAENRRDSELERVPKIVGLHVGYAEKALQAAVRKAGGRWDPAMSVWLVPIAVARRLKLDDRIVQVIPMTVESASESKESGQAARVSR